MEEMQGADTILNIQRTILNDEGPGLHYGMYYVMEAACCTYERLGP